MKPDDHRANHWDAVYQTKSDAQVSWHQPNAGPSLSLLRASALIPGCGPALDVGGGTSRLVDDLLADGWQDITILDIAPTALARNRARLGDNAARVHWVVADILDWRPPGPIALWHDRAVFHFLTDDADRLTYLGKVRDALAAFPGGGQAVIGCFALSGPEKCSGLPVRRHDLTLWQDSLAAVGGGLAILDSLLITHATPWGSAQDFLFVRLGWPHPAVS